MYDSSSISCLLGTDIFKWLSSALKTYHEVVDEIYNRVDHAGMFL